MMKRKGFTLVEIMIVVAIIALLAAIAIPNLLRARVNANEATAQAVLKTIVVASTSWASVTAGTYPEELQNMTQAVPPYLDNTFNTTGSIEKQGYNFTFTRPTSYTFVTTAIPVVANTTGVRSFCITEDGVVRGQSGGGAIADRAACLVLSATQ